MSAVGSAAGSAQCRYRNRFSDMYVCVSHYILAGVVGKRILSRF